ncbi:Leucine-rich repeat-containing N-terminal, plant-type [Dillenia turbinata]|uniref:Leucine-rich repeat-containing N-terminal, plant-type n=1 Tax=Dillenia turbinata TaxID=194707 RepID=A0AAN8Z8I2_9MAGN
MTTTNLFTLTHSKTYLEDIQVLKDLKNSLSPSSIIPGSCLSSWDFSVDPCDNAHTEKFTCGLRCDVVLSGSSRITEITLDQAGYSGSLSSSSSWNLPYLETLDVSNNFLSNSVPDSLSNLTRLRRLSLSGNSFSGKIPTSIGSLYNLEELYLDHNEFEDRIPGSFNGLTSLKRLELQGNKLYDEFPNLGYLINLYYLDVSDNFISGEVPVKTLPWSLVEISMRNNSLEGQVPYEEVSNFGYLQVLDLSHNKLSGSIPASLFSHPSLQQLTLSFNQFSSLQVPANMGFHSELIAVDLSDNQIQGLLPAFMALLPKLSALSMENNKFTGLIPTQYALKAAVPGSGIAPLERLLLGGNYLLGPIPGPLMGLKPGSVNVNLVDNCLYRCPEIFFFCQGGGQKSLMESCNAIDKEALLGFKHKITSDPSNLFQTWTSSSDCCKSWEGVTCDSWGRVVNVSRSGLMTGNDFIMDASISGTLSPSLGNITFLRLLNLSNLKKLKGPIPPEFGKLTHLTFLFLDTNKLTGSIPTSFQYLTRLQKLYLSDNYLCSIPSTIGKLVSLVKLDFHGNNLSGNIPPSIGRLKNLNYLDLLSENKLTGSLPPNLRRLILENNMLTGKLPATLGHLSNLTDIFLANNYFVGKIPSSFGNLGSLQTPDLSRNKLSGPIPPQLAKLKNLQSLDLSYNPLKLVRIPEILAKLDLFRFMLAGTGIVIREITSWIGNMTGLSFLNLSNNGFHSAIPAEFRILSRLMDIDLHSNKFTGNLKRIFGKNVQDPLGYFNSVDLSYNNFTGPIDEDTGDKTATASTESLILSHNPLGGSIPKSLGKLTGFKVLKLAGNGLVGNIRAELGNARELFNFVWRNPKECAESVRAAGV